MTAELIRCAPFLFGGTGALEQAGQTHGKRMWRFRTASLGGRRPGAVRGRGVRSRAPTHSLRAQVRLDADAQDCR